MRDVELAGGAAVVAVGPVGDTEGPPDQRLVDGRQVAPRVLDEDPKPALILGHDDESVELAVERGGGLDHRGAGRSV